MVAEAVVAVSLAVAPAGFREAVSLEPAASWVAGKPVSVYCGVTRNGDSYEAGFAATGSPSIFLAPSLVCAPLELLVAKQRVVSEDAAFGIEVLVHEAEHAKGITDESAAECAALKVTAEVGIRFFGLRGQRRYLRDMMTSAWRQHRALPDTYTRLC